MARAAIRIVDVSKVVDIRVQEIAKTLEDAVYREAQTHQKLWMTPAKNWTRANQPHFTIARLSNRDVSRGIGFIDTVSTGSQRSTLGAGPNKYGGGSFGYDIFTGSSPFVWLEAGTRIRYVRMSRDWKSKTRVGRLRSVMGKGNVVGFAPYGMPGIQPRSWGNVIVKMRRKPFERKVRAALKKGLRNAARRMSANQIPGAGADLRWVNQAKLL